MDRRQLITGLISLVAAPAIVRAGALMPVKRYVIPVRTRFIIMGYTWDPRVPGRILDACIGPQIMRDAGDTCMVRVSPMHGHIELGMPVTVDQLTGELI